MGETYEGSVIGAGTRIQAGVPTRRINYDRKVNGLLLRGVVINTYVSDNTGHPLEAYADDTVKGPPTAVYCDVLVYPSIPGQRWFGLNNVLVTQPTGGMHRGRIWKPRAATVDISGKDLEGQTANPAQLDGDHVLVGFLNDTFDQPIILRGLPHPAVDTGQVEGQDALGTRMKLTSDDKDPDFLKHHGVFYGVDNNGDFVIDSTWANKGKLDEKGREAAPPTDGKGKQTFKLSQDATFVIGLYDMTNPSAPNEVMSVSIRKDKILAKVTQGDTIKVEEDAADAKLTLGDGAVKVAVADHLQTLYGLLKTAYDGHKHPTGTGPSGIPDTLAPDWNTDINSSQMLIPDTQ